MATATEPKRRRSWLRPRFSLRTALLALTAFGVGFPVWYRWPYQEVEILSPSGFGRPVGEKRITTWQRQWGGGKRKHGSERRLRDGQTMTQTNYRDGKKHGFYIEYSLEITPIKSRPTYSRTAEPTTTGQYVDGMKEGVWTYSRGSSVAKLTWRQDQLVNSAR
jgi:hypothetical protein